jgi:hypothetical protein
VELIGRRGKALQKNYKRRVKATTMKLLMSKAGGKRGKGL